MKTHAAFALATLLLGGCAVTPDVDYHRLSDRPRSDAWVPYRLTDTRIAIGAIGDKNPLDLAPLRLVCTASGCSPCPDAACAQPAADAQPIAIGALGVPVDDKKDVLAIEPRTRHFVSTHLSPTYYDGTLRLRTLEVEAQDHRLEAINTIGALVSGAMALATDRKMAATVEAAVLRLPILIDLADAKEAVTDDGIPTEDVDWTYRVTFEDGDPGKLGFLPRDQAAQVHGAIVTSTCRRVTLVLSHGKNIRLTLGLTVADPAWLTTIPFPTKGTLDFHPLCGVDVKAGPTTTIGTDVLAEAFFKQVAAIRAAP